MVPGCGDLCVISGNMGLICLVAWLIWGVLFDVGSGCLLRVVHPKK